MVQRYKCVIFDVDGTLLDTSEGLISAVRYTINQFGLEQLDENVVRTFIGPPIQDSFKRVYGFGDDKIRAMSYTFRERYKDEELLKARPYEGIYDVLETLVVHGIKLAIATYKRQDYAAKLLKSFGFNKYTNIICGSDFEGKLRKKDITELALKDAGIRDYSGALMVGDSDNDAIGAEKIGIDFLGVTYGFGFETREDIYKFKAIGAAESTDEILKMII